MKNGKKLIGQAAEKQAQSYLEHQGLIWVCSNYRCPAGEVDLIMTEGDNLIFVEVRYRSLVEYGESAETVGPRKQSRIIKAAWHYLLKIHKMDKLNCRFDVVGLNAQNEINWIQNAFEVKY